MKIMLKQYERMRVIRQELLWDEKCFSYRFTLPSHQDETR